MFPYGSFLTQIPLIILGALYLAWAGAFLVRKYDGSSNVQESGTASVSVITVNDCPIYNELLSEEAVQDKSQDLFCIPLPENEDLPPESCCLKKSCCHYTEEVLFPQPPPVLI